MEMRKWSSYGVTRANFPSFPMPVTGSNLSLRSTQACGVDSSLQTSDLLWEDENHSRSLRGS